NEAELHRIPRAPVFGWRTLSRAAEADRPRLDAAGPSLLTTSGRAAIMLGLRALGVGAGDRVLVPTYHCPTMIEPVVRLGAVPLFYPIGRDGHAILDFLCSLQTEHAKAMLAAHFFGLPQDLAKLRAWCDENEIGLIEDCAHAYFGEGISGPIGSA